MRFRLFGRVFYISKTVIAVSVLIVCAFAAFLGKILLNKDETQSDLRLVTAVPSEAAATPAVTDQAVSTAVPTPSPVLIAIHLTGCIANEGVYYIEDNSILSDAVDSAGGLTEDADTHVINLAMHLHDGMHIHIPSVNDKDKTWILEYGDQSVSDDSSSDNGPVLVNINTASASELQKLSGVGESTAQDIIRYRNQYGPFQRIEDIMNVPGIKEAKFARIKDYITV